MEKGLLVLSLLVMTVALSSGYCPQEKMTSIGFCSYKIHCIGTIRGIRLKKECLMYSDKVNVDLELVEAVERINEKLSEIEFLNLVTTFKASANWPETSLSLLEYMPRLKLLNLTDNNIRYISGTPFFNLNRLVTIDLSHNNITDIFGLFLFQNEPSSLKYLNLAYNYIEELNGGEFEDVKSLVELDLSHNMLSDLTDESFANLTSLEVLKLNHNKLSYLNGSLNSLYSLKQLYLSENSIKLIDKDSLVVIQHLEVFDVSHNYMSDLLPDILHRDWYGSGWFYQSVFKIFLSGNYIPFVPNATIGYHKDISRFTRNTFSETDSLNTELDLSHNLISNIEYNGFQSLVNLRKLDLAYNKLIDFVVNSNDLVKVQFLNLSNNYLTNIYYETFRSMTKLTNLDLSYNSLEYIPKETFKNNIYLKYVNMTFNSFKQIDNINIGVFHPEGGILDMSHNSIAKLNIPFGEALRLTKLCLNSNQIEDLAEVNLYYQIELRFLELNRNGIMHLNEDVVRLPYGLIFLDISFNEISDIGAFTFKQFNHLEQLRLGHNSLEKIPFGAFQGMSALKYLDLSFNRIGVLDSKTFMDLKHLNVLSLRNNQMYSMSYNSWYDHDKEIKVYLDGNNFTCDWVGNALSNFKSGFSKMRPAVMIESHADNALAGIPCELSNEVLANYEMAAPKSVVVDERLLMTNQKILDVLKEQTEVIKKMILFKK